MNTHRAIAKADVLYHATPAQNALSILTTDSLTLRLGNTLELQKIGDFRYWASMARTRSSSFIKDNSRNSVVFTIDGRKLGMHAKLVPMDYWSNLRQGHESEERLLYNKPELHPFSAFLKEAALIAPTTQKPERVEQLVAWCKKRKLPLSVYASYNDWLRRKPVPVPDVPDDTEAEPFQFETYSNPKLSEFNSSLHTYLFGWQDSDYVPLLNRDSISMAVDNVNSLGNTEANQMIRRAAKLFKVKTLPELTKAVDAKWQTVEAAAANQRAAKHAEQAIDRLMQTPKQYAEHLLEKFNPTQALEKWYGDVLAGTFRDMLDTAEGQAKDRLQYAQTPDVQKLLPEYLRGISRTMVAEYLESALSDAETHLIEQAWEDTKPVWQAAMSAMTGTPLLPLEQKSLQHLPDLYYLFFDHAKGAEHIMNWLQTFSNVSRPLARRKLRELIGSIQHPATATARRRQS